MRRYTRRKISYLFTTIHNLQVRVVSRAVIFTVLLFALVGSVNTAKAQDKNLQKIFQQAEKAYHEENYMTALKLYEELDSLQPKNPYYNFMLGVCCLFTNTGYERAIPHLEFAAKEISDPSLTYSIYYNLGWAYHVNNRYDDAIASFEKVLSEENTRKVLKMNARRRIQMCNNAKELVKKPTRATIENVGMTINSRYSDYSPIISADETELFFTSRRKGSTGGQIFYNDQYYDDIYISTRQKGAGWSFPINLGTTVNSVYHDASIALSVDGQQLFIYRSNKQKKKGELLSVKREGLEWGELQPLSSSINTGSYEASASISADGQSIYFTSSREGGKGGRDIYKAKLMEDGTWGEAVNLGPNINTEFDEEGPFIHPDNKTLYFSSDGNKSMGGFDIFKSTLTEDGWGVPENVGYPINTAADDIHFVLSADGKTGYYASARAGGYGEEDIYRIKMPDVNIPLTMVRGTVVTQGSKKVEVKIKVLDKESNNEVRYTYNPNPETGKYLMIFPPGKNYDMIVEADGYVPYVFNIHIPNQTYFYQLHQTMYLRTIDVGEDTIAQGISIENTFYDQAKDTSLTYEQSLVEQEKQAKKDKVLLDLIDRVIQTTDSLAMANLDEKADSAVRENFETSKERYNPLISLVEEIMEHTDQSALQNLDKIVESGFFEKANEEILLFYNNTNLKLTPFPVGGDTIYVALPGIQQTNDSASSRVDEVTIKSVLAKVFYFETGEFVLSEQDKASLDKIIDIFNEFSQLRAEIAGYTDNVGTAESNIELSQNRAQVVEEYLISKGIQKQRLLINAFGEENPAESNATERGKAANRRVEISVIQTTVN